MFARFDENPAMTLQVIKETKRYGRTDGQRENSIPTTNKVCGGYKNTGGLRVSYDKQINYVCMGNIMHGNSLRKHYPCIKGHNFLLPHLSCHDLDLDVK